MVVADRPRSADFSRQDVGGWSPASRRDAVEATGDPEGAKGDTDAEDSRLRDRLLLAGRHGAGPDGGAGPIEGPAGPECLAGLPPDALGCRVRYPGGPEGHRCVQGGAGDRQQPQHRLLAAGRPGEDASPVRRGPGPQHGPVELLPGRVRGLPRDRPERRQGPRRGPLDERRRHPGRDGQGWQDRRLEADLGGGGLEGLRAGTGAGDRRRRHVAAGDGHGDAGRAGGRRTAPRGGRQGGRGRRGPRRAGQCPGQVADRLDPPDGVEPVRRHLSPRDPGGPGRRAREGRGRL